MLTWSEARRQAASRYDALLADMEEIIIELQTADMEEVEQTIVREERKVAATPPPLP